MDQQDKNTQLIFYLIQSFEMTAMIQMGKIKDPNSDKSERNLQLAQFSIDLLDMLKEKTKGNLGEYEQKFLDNTISQLKLNYIDEAEKEKKEKEQEKKEEEKSKDNGTGDAGTEKQQ
jgi:hypothetical protein